MSKLQQIHAAGDLEFLRIPPSNRLEALKGDRRAQLSIRINDQWRVCFRYAAGHASEVEIVDYHRFLQEMIMPREVPLSTPGEILLEEWLTPMGVTQYALGKAIGVPPRRIHEIVKGQRAITADAAVRLAAYFGTDAQSWMNLQALYDTELAKERIGALFLAEIRQHATSV